MCLLNYFLIFFEKKGWLQLSKNEKDVRGLRRYCKLTSNNFTISLKKGSKKAMQTISLLRILQINVPVMGSKCMFKVIVGAALKMNVRVESVVAKKGKKKKKNKDKEVDNQKGGKYL